MEIKDVFDAGGEILNVVADAVNRNDFSGLSESVRGTVSRTIQQVQADRTASMSRGAYGRDPQSGTGKGTGSQGMYGAGPQSGTSGGTGSQGMYGAGSQSGTGKGTGSQGMYGAGSQSGTSGGTGSQGMYGTGSQSGTPKGTGVQGGYRTGPQYGTAKGPQGTDRVSGVYETGTSGTYHNPVGRQYQFKGREPSLPVTMTRSPKGRILGPLQMGGGILGLSLFGITAIVMGAILGSGGGAAFAVLTAVFGGLTCYSISHVIRGKSKIGLVNRFYRYARIIGAKSYIAIEEIANQTGLKRDEIIKDLKRMTGLNMFPQGRLDDRETTFMLTREVYDQYRLLEDGRRQQEEEAKAELEAHPQNARTRQILAEGNDYILRVRRSNDIIHDKVMSDKLDRLERIMRKIFEQVDRHPESAENLHKFMTYYLPTTGKLLDAYIDLDRQEISGENIQSTKREIEETLDTINEAFENLLDSMFEDTAWDISSDISVMKTMMAQEGLTGGGGFR